MTGDRAAPALRTAVAADVVPLARLIESAYRGEASRVGWTTEADLLDGPRTSVGEVGAIVAGPGTTVVVAESGGRIVGCCQLEQRPPRGAYLGMLSVEPALQGGGIGRAVVTEAERVAAQEWGADRLSMQVIRQREDLIPWYERLGYRRTGEIVPFPDQQPAAGARRPDLEFAVLVKPLV